MFFDDLGELKKRALMRELPPIPETGWRAPTHFPNLSDATVIGFDVERKENDWDHGPGWAKGRASTVGFSVSARDRCGNLGSWYFPIRHAVESFDNLDVGNCLDWLRSVLQTRHIPKVGANLIYDIGSLTDDNIFVEGELHDCQFAEALLQSDGLVGLDYLGLKYLGVGKETNLLYEWIARAYPERGKNPDPRQNIWRSPPRLVGPYGERDALSPLQVIERQYPLLEAKGLIDLYRMECGLIPLLVKMRRQGVTVNLQRAHSLMDELTIDELNLYARLRHECPVKIESVNSGKDLARIFDYIGIKYPLTKEGNPSFRKDYLATLDHPVADLINEIRGVVKARDTFVRNYIIEGHVNGKIFCQFHPLRNDEGGTITGRFSSSDPNLQNIPVRTETGKKIRRAFTFDEGHEQWEKVDYSQIEYRYLANYAVGPGSDELRAKYNADKKTDYHKATQGTVKAIANVWIERRPIKNLNFGLVFGMGEPKLARQNNFSKAEATKIFAAYHLANPYVKATAKAIAQEAQILGYITTILGRQIQFNYWEPKWRDYNEERKIPMPYEAAIRYYGQGIVRANTHKAVNYRLQGSGTGDQIKMGMYRCYKDGIFDVIGVPKIQVHDELGMSVIDQSNEQNEAYAAMRRTMETCLPIRVPVFVDHKRGVTWGDCE